ncbi:MAG: ABC transporter ATP-binding protein [Acidimicrobiales bacterium]
MLAVDRVDLSVAAHEFVSIVGPSGCGKSTLLLMIAGLRAPTSGTVFVDGNAVREPITDVGIVFQQDLLLPWRTALGNVMLQLDVRGSAPDGRDRALALLRRVGLEGFEDVHPAALSGGMRQRVALCRALVHGAPLLLMDEPFGALDALTRQAMNYDLMGLWESERKTVVLITHSIAEAVLLSDRVAIMSPRPGRIVEVVDIDLPHPRTAAVSKSDAFSRLVGHIEDRLLGSGEQHLGVSTVIGS